MAEEELLKAYVSIGIDDLAIDKGMDAVEDKIGGALERASAHYRDASKVGKGSFDQVQASARAAAEAMRFGAGAAKSLASEAKKAGDALPGGKSLSQRVGKSILQGLGIGAGMEIVSRVTRNVVALGTQLGRAAVEGNNVFDALNNWVHATFGIETSTQRIAEMKDQAKQTTEIFKQARRELEGLAGVKAAPGQGALDALDKQLSELREKQEAESSKGGGLLGGLGIGGRDPIEIARLQDQIDAKLRERTKYEKASQEAAAELEALNRRNSAKLSFSGVADFAKQVQMAVGQKDTAKDQAKLQAETNEILKRMDQKIKPPGINELRPPRPVF